MSRRGKVTVGLLLGALAVPTLFAVVTVPQGPAVFHSGTRLVEVEVVVRGQRVRPPGARAFLTWLLDSGPPFGPPGDPLTGLTQDDFALFDDGKPQPISLFRARASASEISSAALPAGAVSNREDGGGGELNGPTTVLIDLLNTQFELTEYARVGLRNMLRTLGEKDTRIAVYSLGEKLHVLHDFTDDPRKLTEIAAALDQPNGRLPADLAKALGDYGDLMALGGGGRAAAGVHAQITVKALRSIVQHLSGVPGRKNLVWLTGLTRLPPTVMDTLQRANIVLYPVGVRGIGLGTLEGDLAQRELGLASGGRAFFDAMDLSYAVETAREDSRSAYVLGYYPPEDALDGRFHKISVQVRGAKFKDQVAELHYRSGYLATKVALAPPTLTLAELFAGELASSGIGLSGHATPVAGRPGSYDVHVTIDLHDIHLERNNGRFTGSFDYAVPNAAAQRSFKTGRVALNLTDAQLNDALQGGLDLVIKDVDPGPGEIRVAVRDRATGVGGSLRIP